MRICFTWITFSLTLAFTSTWLLPESMAAENGKQETDPVSTQVKTDPVLEAQNLLGTEVPDEETAPAELGSLLSAEPHPTRKKLDAICQPWVKPVLCTQDLSEGNPSNMAKNKTGNTTALRERPTGGTTLTKTQPLSCIGSPGTNDFFLPVNANPPVFPAASQVMNHPRSFSARAIFQPTPKRQLVDRQPDNRRGLYREIPQTLSPKTIPKIIPGQEMRTSPRQIPIILRAVPQGGSFRQAGSTARIKMNLPRHQERVKPTDDSPASRQNSTPTETLPSTSRFHEIHTNQESKRLTSRPEGSDTNR